VVLKKIFKDFQFFNQLEAMAAIFNISQGQRTHFLEEEHSKSFTSKFGPI
jgi:hypothetical protein